MPRDYLKAAGDKIDALAAHLPDPSDLDVGDSILMDEDEDETGGLWVQAYVFVKVEEAEKAGED